MHNWKAMFISFSMVIFSSSLFAAADNDKQLLSPYVSETSLAAQKYVEALLAREFGHPEKDDNKRIKMRLPDETQRGQLHRMLAIKNKVASSWTLTQQAIAIKIFSWYSGEEANYIDSENCFPKVFIDDPVLRRQLFLLVNIEDEKFDEIFLAVAKKGLLGDEYSHIFGYKGGDFERDLMRPNLEKLKDYDQDVFCVSEIVSLLNAQFLFPKQCFREGQSIDDKKLVAIDKQVMEKREVESRAQYQKVFNDPVFLSFLSPGQKNVLELLAQSQGQGVLKLRNMVLNLVNEHKSKNEKLENAVNALPSAFFVYDTADPALKECPLPYWRDQALLHMVRSNLTNR